MEKTEFINAMVEYAEKYGEVKVEDIVRPNSTYTGLMIKKEAGIPSPVVHIEWLFELFDNGRFTLDDCYDKVDEILSMKEDFDVSDILKWTKAKSKLFLKVFGKKPDGLYRKVEDLYLVPYIQVAPDDSAAARVVPALLDKWDMDEDTVFECARLNQETLRPEKIVSIAEQLGIEEEIPVYVVSTISGINGAGVIFYEGICEKIKERLGEDFYIIPSSIHEVLVVPKSASPDTKHLQTMVAFINATEVQEEDRLTDSVYTYDFDTEEFRKVEE